MADIFAQELKKELTALAEKLASLVFYKDLCDHDVFKAYIDLLKACGRGREPQALEAYAGFCRALTDESPEASWPLWLCGQILLSVNPVSRAAAADEPWRDAFLYELTSLTEAMRKDGYYMAKALQNLFPERAFPVYDRGPEPLKTDKAGLCEGFHAMRKVMLGWHEPDPEALLAFYKINGYGLPAKYKAMIHTPEGLVGVKRLDPILPEDLFDYSGNLDRLIRNTEDFLAGKPSSHVLLYGTRGCGKSSAVKAMLNRYENRGLRLIEINPRNLSGLSSVMRRAAESSLRFILFIDDLSFRATDQAYAELKSFLQGGAMDIPENCRLYVTSNRRHLVLEQLDEAEQEIYGNDGLDERVSLSDRFGLKLHFLAPLQREYLDVVRFLVSAGGITPDEELEKKALAFAQKQGHRSPREAKLFAEKYIAEHTSARTKVFL